MGSITCDGKTVPFCAVPSTDKKRLYTSFVQDGAIHVYVPDGAGESAARALIRQRFYDFYYKLHPEEWHAVHYLGEVYHAECRVAKAAGVTIEGDRMIIRARTESTRAYKAVLLAFFKQAVERELVALMYDAAYDFREIVLPPITVKSLRGFLGYNYVTSITLSPQIARYEKKYIKALLYHELCHSLVRGHGEDFWALFEKKYPGGRALGEERNALAYDAKDYL